MKSFVRASVCILVLCAAASAGDVRVIVGFKGRPHAEALRRAGGRQLRTLTSGSAVSAVVPARAVSQLRADPNVAYVEEDGIARALAKPQATQPAQQTPWGVTKVGAPLTGNVGAGIKVAVIDTGVDLDHPDLQANIKGSVDFTGSRKGADDENGHGTHVAGTIGALNNSIGVVGVAPGAHLYAVRVLDRRGYGWWSDVAEGVSWCGDAANGIDIANMSLGGPSAPSAVKDACDDAADTVLLIAAAGNSGDGNTATSEVEYPAYYSSVVSVGATDSSDALASFSCTNSDVELSGPGVSVLSTYKGGAYATGSGTSMSAPHAAGVAALYWWAATSPSAGSVRSSLQTNARDLGPTGQDAGYGYGVVLYK
jgi:subtilisin family serine protease